jgi:hypothetical protein
VEGLGSQCMSNSEASPKRSDPTAPDAPAPSDRKDVPLSEAELDAVTGGAGKTAVRVPDIDTGQKKAVDI